MSLKIFSGRATMDLSGQIAKKLGVELGDMACKSFADGEMWIKYSENIRGCDVFLIQSTTPPADNLMELLIMMDAARRASARSITAVIPYFGYARQDRKDQPRVAITAKLVADILTQAGADRIITMDLHAPQVQGFFNIPVDHLYASNVFLSHFKKMNLPNLAVVSPDAGRTKVAMAYAKRLDADLVIIDKRRVRANHSEVMNIIGDIKGKTAIIIDDMIDTGGTFVNAVKAVHDQGAAEIYGACTHAVLSGDAIEKINNSHLTKLFIANTIPLRRECEKIEVQSVAKLFAEAIYRINKNESVSSLFDY